MKITGFGIANYRSFLGEGSFVHDFGKVNVFIGKNNSGKSNILRFLQSLSSGAAARHPGEPVRVSELDRNRKATGQILLGVAVDLESREDLSYALGDPRKSLPKTIEVWMEFPGGQAAGANSLESFTDDWLIRFHNKLTHMQYTGRPARQALLKDTYAGLADQAKTDLLHLMEKLIYVPAIREIRTVDGDETRGVIDLSGRNLVKQRLRQMQHPVVGKEPQQDLFHRIEGKLQELLGVNDLEMEIQPEDDEIILKIDAFASHSPIMALASTNLSSCAAR